MVFRTIYISSTRGPQAEGTIDDILESSRRNNRRSGLTGLLIFDGKRFLQYIEGGEHEVRATLERIKQDPRHYALVVLSEKQTERRQFGDWAMAGHSVGADEDLADCVARLTTGCDPAVATELISFARVRPRAA